MTLESDTRMRNIQSSSWIIFLSIGALVAVLSAAGVLTPGAGVAQEQQAPVPPQPNWAAAAPGRVEPKGRELRIIAPSPGVIKDVLVGLNDHVQRGDLLIRLDDEELLARLAAAKAQVTVRTTERDYDKVVGAALDHRKAEDSLYAAERSAFDAKVELDRLIADFRANKVTAENVQAGRAAVAAAADKVEQEQQKLKKVQAKNPPGATREEAALTAARAEVSVLSANLEHMRIRSPIDGTALELRAKVGEMAGATAEIPLLVLGDTTHLQVRAEVEERDVSKIFAGQTAVVKSEAFPGRLFDVKVSQMAKALGAPQLAARSQRKQTDVDVLEVILDLEEGAPLLPGMRVDVLFREAETAAPKTVQANPNT